MSQMPAGMDPMAMAGAGGMPTMPNPLALPGAKPRKSGRRRSTTGRRLHAKKPKVKKARRAK